MIWTSTGAAPASRKQIPPNNVAVKMDEMLGSSSEFESSDLTQSDSRSSKQLSKRFEVVEGPVPGAQHVLFKADDSSGSNQDVLADAHSPNGGAQSSATGADLAPNSLAAHEAGVCHPCFFVFGKAGCTGGASCRFCHMPHTWRRKPRPCKKKRERKRRYNEKLLGGEGGGEVPASSEDEGGGTWEVERQEPPPVQDPSSEAPRRGRHIVAL